MPGPRSVKDSPFRADLLRDQVALVTGGGSGIGLATARAFLQLGAKVAICGRNNERLGKASSLLEAEFPGQVLAKVADIREPQQVEALVAEILARLGGLSILVNNAGGQFPAPAAAISPKGFEAVVRNNLLGTFNVTREAAVKAFIPQQHGVIVNVIANIARGFPGMAHTGAARAGVENLTMTLAVEWAHFGIRVNALAPGIIASEGIQQYPAELVEGSRKRTPLKRLGTVDECADAIVYLASPAASYVTGATLRIDGGASLWGDSWQIPEPQQPGAGPAGFSG